MLPTELSNEYQIEKAGLLYRVYLPEEAGDGPRPLVVLMHGRCGNENNMWLFCKAFKRSKPIIVAPRGSWPDEFNGLTGYSWWKIEGPEDGLQAIQIQENELLPVVRQFKQFITAICGLYPVDQKRITAVGFSQGSMVSAALSFLEPELFSGVAILSGAVPNVCFESVTFSPIKDQNKPSYFVAHGNKDQTLPINIAENGVEKLKELGASVSFVTDATGHKIGIEGLKGLENWYSNLNVVA